MCLTRFELFEWLAEKARETGVMVIGASASRALRILSDFGVEEGALEYNSPDELLYVSGIRGLIDFAFNRTPETEEIQQF